MTGEKHALYVPQGFAVHTNGKDGVDAVLIDGMGPCTWVTVCSTDPKKPFLAATHADTDTNLGTFIEEAVKSGSLGKDFKVQMGSKHNAGTYELAGEQVDLTKWYERQVAAKTQELGGKYNIHPEDSGAIVIGVNGSIIKNTERASEIYFQDIETHNFAEAKARSCNASVKSMARTDLHGERLDFMIKYSAACKDTGKKETSFKWNPVVIWNNGDRGDEASREIYTQAVKQANVVGALCPQARKEYLAGGGTLFTKPEFMAQDIQKERPVETKAPRIGSVSKTVLSEIDPNSYVGKLAKSREGTAQGTTLQR